MSVKSFFVDLFSSEIKDKNGNLLGTVVGEQAISCYYKELAIQMSINLIEHMKKVKKSLEKIIIY